MKINIFDVIKSKSALFHPEGIIIFNLIKDALSSNENVDLSFEGIENCSTQFLNASIGNIFVKFPDSLINSNLKFSNYHQIALFESKLEDVRINSKHSEEYNRNFEEAITY
jgi:hypothetical protein